MIPIAAAVIGFFAPPMGAAVLVAWLLLLILSVLRRRASDRFGKTLKDRLDPRVPLTEAVEREIREARAQRLLTRASVDYEQQAAYLNLLEATVQDGMIEDAEQCLLGQVERLFAMSAEFSHRARRDAYRLVYLKAVSDHHLTEDEERQLESVRVALDVSEDDIAEEMAFVDQLRQVRSIREGPGRATSQNGTSC